LILLKISSNLETPPTSLILHKISSNLETLMFMPSSSSSLIVVFSGREGWRGHEH